MHGANLESKLYPGKKIIENSFNSFLIHSKNYGKNVFSLGKLCTTCQQNYYKSKGFKFKKKCFKGVNQIKQ